MADRPTVVVVGLGPAGPGLVTAATLELIARIPYRWARTSRHPAITVLGDCATFDEVYERAEVIGDVYVGIVDRLADEAIRHGRVLYAVPGSPSVAERTVELLVERAADRGDVDVEVHPALSFVDLAWVRLGVDPLSLSPRLVDGHRFAIDAAGERGPLLVAQCDSREVLGDIKLSVEDPPRGPVAILVGLGGTDEAVHWVPWDELDRTLEPDHLTSLWIPDLAAPVASELVAFDELVTRLRDGCPWDRAQTHASLRRYLLEEAYEVLEAIDLVAAIADRAGSDQLAADADEALCEELGDLLFQIFFHARIATETGRFTLADVARRVHDKLRDRHPHVFGSSEVPPLDELTRSWEEAKRQEKQRASVMDDVPAALPSLARAAKVLERAAALGPAAPAVGDVSDAVTAFEASPGATSLGEAILALAAAAVAIGVDAEEAGRAEVARHEQRARRAESGTAGP